MAAVSAGARAPGPVTFTMRWQAGSSSGVAFGPLSGPADPVSAGFARASVATEPPAPPLLPPVPAAAAAPAAA